MIEPFRLLVDTVSAVLAMPRGERLRAFHRARQWANAGYLLAPKREEQVRWRQFLDYLDGAIEMHIQGAR